MNGSILADHAWTSDASTRRGGDGGAEDRRSRPDAAALFVARFVPSIVDPFGESGPDEPEEFDPDSLGPDVPEAPDVEPDLDDGLDVSDVDDELVTAFWGAAFFLNVAVAALAIGSMLVYFRGDWTNGGGALVVGTVAAVFTARYYFGYQRSDDESADSEGEGKQEEGHR